MRSKRLREDLYYRLDVFRIHLPPLRERRRDIPALVRHFLSALRRGAAPLEVPPSEMEALAAYDWPGNLRELRNVVERTVILHRGGPIRPSLLLGPTPSAGPPPSGPSHATAPAEGDLPLEEVERNHIETVVARTGGNLTRAAAVLGISVSTLRRKVGTRSNRSTPVQNDRAI